MRAYKVEKENKHANKIVGRLKGSKALFCLVPCLELLIKAFDEVVGDGILKALHLDVFDTQHRLNRYFVGAISIGDDGLGFS